MEGPPKFLQGQQKYGSWLNETKFLSLSTTGLIVIDTVQEKSFTCEFEAQSEYEVSDAPDTVLGYPEFDM